MLVLLPSAPDPGRFGLVWVCLAFLRIITYYPSFFSSNGIHIVSLDCIVKLPMIQTLYLSAGGLRFADTFKRIGGNESN